MQQVSSHHRRRMLVGLGVRSLAGTALAMLVLTLTVATLPLGAETLPFDAETMSLGAGEDALHARLLREVARLHQTSNSLRLAALEALLRQHRIAFTPQRVPCRGCQPRDYGTNLIVEIGTGPRDLIIGAHYDAAQLLSGALSSGMVDNGAGVVVLLNLVAKLAELDLRHRVRAVFFDMEERGMAGSRHFVASLDPARVTAAINLDVVAAGDTVVFGPLAGVERVAAPVVAALGKACLELVVSCLDFAAFPPGDDISFRQAEIPTLSMAILPRMEAHQLWLLLNSGAASGLRPGFVPRTVALVNSPLDTIEQIQPEAMTRMHQVVTRMVRILDAGPASAGAVRVGVEGTLP